jgi:hypothetical protein
MELIRARQFCLPLLIFSISSSGKCEDPAKVTACQLKADPPAYSHKLVEVTGFFTHGFEDSTFFDPTCASWPEIWLEYGGNASTGTVYCCGPTNERTRPEPITVDNVQIPLISDEHFQKFDALLHRPRDAVVHAIVVGRFFAGRMEKTQKGTFWGGYGHFGCCSLLVIQQVLSVDPQDRKDLDYGSSSDQPDLNRPGCGYENLTPLPAFDDLMKAQRKAELGDHSWAFDDPQRVAIDSLSRFEGLEENAIKSVKTTLKRQGRIVYEWYPPGKKVNYIVVVGRPYWLSFYSKDAHQVAWVVEAAYKSTCGKENTVTRIK